jgi:cysteine desulfurase
LQSQPSIYLDHAATTRASEDVVHAVTQAMLEVYGNPSSLHTVGQLAERTLKTARRQVADALGVSSANIIFTGSGTEADNLAILAGFKNPEKIRGRKVILSAFEHPAVREAALSYGQHGADVVFLPIDQSTGCVKPSDLSDALDRDAVLVSVMHVNNETGAVQPIEELSQVLSGFTNRYGEKPLFHTDAVQSFGKIPVPAACADLVSISAHKIHGPKGVGALYARRPDRLQAAIRGGGQEGGIRSGTENVPGIVGFGLAAEAAAANLAAGARFVLRLRSMLRDGILSRIPQVKIGGPFEASLEGRPGTSSPYILSVIFPGTRAEVLVHDLERHGIYVSTGSACANIGRKNRKGGNSILEAAGYTREEAEATLRFSFGKENTPEEIESVLTCLEDAVGRFRQLSPKYHMRLQ